MDGIDISFVNTNGLDLKRLNKNYFYEYSLKTKEKLRSYLKEDLNFNLRRKSFLDEFVTNEHYQALKDLDIIKACDLIGFHGQTLYHDPNNKVSIQLGNPKKLSQMLNKDVIFDFRLNDLSLGGQGAPLAPIYHRLIIEKHNIELPCCFLNIGGVSNLTFWDGNTLIGFDTGPGNALMDDFMSKKFGKKYDHNGNFASKGSPLKEEVKKFLQHEFFNKPPPKSLDREAFRDNYEELIKKNYLDNDIMSTLLEFSVETIASSLGFIPKKINNILITGGGYRNTFLMKRLSNKLKVKILTEKDINIDFDYIEAELIAYLSARSIYNLPFTFPSTTGVLKESSGGILHKKPF
ncbi:anhydro-N-acetylmuramic acid kinase [Alphaproteobacteria bacterium]|nr:anhydro-N-acetylmuramic acid kinase [Alphaproteobacteria bacterium]